MSTAPSQPRGLAKHLFSSVIPSAEKDGFQGLQGETETENRTKLYSDIFYIDVPKVKFNLSVWYSN